MAAERGVVAAEQATGAQGGAETAASSEAVEGMQVEGGEVEDRGAGAVEGMEAADGEEETGATPSTAAPPPHPPPPTLVYFPSRKGAREAAGKARAMGRRGAYYGADMGRRSRAEVEKR